MFEARLSRLVNANQQDLLAKGLNGIEKESLRIAADGMISQRPHSKALGSALTHPHITTDYSEALLEFITPPAGSIEETLNFLEEIHQYVYDQLDDEMLLATSMPCGISGDLSIPIAEYGKSNVGRMKHVYRVGLGYRYGRTMQAIAGIHYNYSVATSFWPVFQALEKNSDDPRRFIDQHYFALIRNWQRIGWLILFLFGSSPAICKSFLADRKQFHDGFEEFDPYTLFNPYATCLRMSDIGYKSRNQANLIISYNSLQEYVDSLTNAIDTPFEEYEKIGIKVNGRYRQLTPNVLQIENEFYSSIRPKQIAFSGEKPTFALLHRGVRYIEIRSLDIGAFHSIGVDAQTLRFIEGLIWFCLLTESPHYNFDEGKVIKANFLNVAYRGRDPKLGLNFQGREIRLREWAMEICTSMTAICEILDQDDPEKPYTTALHAQIESIKDSELTPSAKILEEMRNNGESFRSFALRISRQYDGYFKARRLHEQGTLYFRQKAEESLAKQVELESKDSLSFDEYLSLYFAQ